MKRLVLALVIASGCSSVAIVDDVDIHLDFTPLIGPSDGLHTPYVEGAQMTLYIESQHKGSMATWTVVSSDPAVFAVSGDVHTDDKNGSTYSVQGVAGKEGTATIDVHDGASILHSRVVTVGHPDRIDLLPHGPLLVSRSDTPAVFSDDKVLAGGTSTYLAQYYRGSEQLFGNRALTLSNTAGATAEVLQSFLLENRDWLQISPTAGGTTWSTSLVVGGTEVTQIAGVTATASDVAMLAIVGQDESHAHKDDWLVALGQARDAAGKTVYGVDFTWSVDGAAEDGIGDLYRYHYDGALPKMLTAAFGTTSAAAMIHSGGGFVDSTNHVGCSLAHSASDGRGLFVIGIFMALALWKRRAIMRRNVHR